MLAAVAVAAAIAPAPACARDEAQAPSADGQPELSLSLSVKALLRGIVAPRSIELYRPSLQVTRRPDGTLEVGFGQGEEASDLLSSRLLARLAAEPDEVARALVDSGRAASRPDTVSGPVEPHRPPATHRSGRPAPHRVIASLRSVERGDLHSPGPPNELRPAGPSEILATLHAAVGDHRRIWLTFAEGRGDRLTHLIEPLQIDGGDVCAFDHTVAEIRTIPLERIVASATA